MCIYIIYATDAAAVTNECNILSSSRCAPSSGPRVQVGRRGFECAMYHYAIRTQAHRFQPRLSYKYYTTAYPRADSAD